MLLPTASESSGRKTLSGPYPAAGEPEGGGLGQPPGWFAFVDGLHVSAGRKGTLLGDSVTAAQALKPCGPEKRAGWGEVILCTTLRAAISHQNNLRPG